MIDAALVAKKLARVEACVADLDEHGRADRLETDVVMQRFVEHTLQLAIQAALDVASHIVSGERLGEPATNHDLFTLLGRAGWIGPDMLPVLRAMVGFRNVLVHEYDDVDLSVVRDVLERRLGDLLAYVEAVRARLRP